MNQRADPLIFPGPQRPDGAGHAPSKPDQRAGRRPRVGTILALMGAAVLVVAGWLWLKSGSATAVYVTEPVIRGSLARTVVATGTVNPELTIIVGTYVSGIITELNCDYGTRVSKGQVCARIDPRPYQAVVDQNKANLDVARAQLAKDQAALVYARLSLDRQSRLVKTDTVTRDAFDSATSAYAQAQAQVAFDTATIEQRQAELSSSRIDLDYTDITAPVEGTVVSRNVTVGQTVAASFQTPTLFLIASDLTRMQVDANVSESDIGGIRVGQAASFSVDAYPGRFFNGTVTQVRQSPQMVQNVITYDVVISADNRDRALMPGMTAATAIVVDTRENVLRVPNASLRFRPPDAVAPDGRGQAEVWMVRDGAAVPVAVSTGLDDDRFTEIVKGDLKTGDRVIVGVEPAGRAAVPRPRL